MLFHKFSHRFGKFTAKSSMNIFIKILECQNAKEKKRKNMVSLVLAVTLSIKYSNYGMMAKKIALSFDLFSFLGCFDVVIAGNNTSWKHFP